jgi:hypothetical protein
MLALPTKVWLRLNHGLNHLHECGNYSKMNFR